MLAIVPPDVASRLSGLPQALHVAMTSLHAAPWFPLVLLAAAVSFLGGLSAWFGAAARLPFAIGVDRMLPKALGYRDPKTGAPTVSLWLQAALTVPIMVLSALGASVAGAYDFVVSMGVLTFIIPYLWMFMAYWKVQSRPADGLDFKTPGGPKAGRALAALGLIVSFTAVLGSMAPSPDAADKLGTFLKLMIASAVMIGLGAFIYGINHLRTRGKANG
jgi:amino acid transporter